ncbi:DUF3152 domain-containing protein [Jiangella rhizosphaerae]|uniref:DUF3152 domain-containing protein n=1 Tax=Jiangella rhizosphaerae TaxID=2293569 RepID=A0A418KIH6_9ACTN|nr:DUF3152 domain-containing protein [Jiangella rhizosphaerae]RIQ12657.1 DUF3152 domain-containing protein [Jiangella rhizosphaerae]
MASRVRRAGHRDRGRRRAPESASGGRGRRLGGLALGLAVLGFVGWAVVPDGEPVAGNAALAPPEQRPPKTLVVLPAARPAPASSATPTAPPTPQVPATGPGTFTVTPGQSARAGTQGTLLTYTVEVETGLPFDPIEVAAVVDTTLADPRSWIAGGRFSFQRVPSGGDLRILVATPGTTDELCAPLRTRGQVSCRNGENVVLNALRWAVAVPHYDGDVAGYRQYVVNHEVGHALGEGHVACPGPGQVAPVMLQQTYGLDGCVANSWPYP